MGGGDKIRCSSPLKKCFLLYRVGSFFSPYRRALVSMWKAFFSSWGPFSSCDFFLLMEDFYWFDPFPIKNSASVNASSTFISSLHVHKLYQSKCQKCINCCKLLLFLLISKHFQWLCIHLSHFTLFEFSGFRDDVCFRCHGFAYRKLRRSHWVHEVTWWNLQNYDISAHHLWKDYHVKGFLALKL